VTERGEIAEEVRDKVFAEMRAHFRPEFLNRVDEIVLFKPLQLEEIKRIVDLLIGDVRRRLEERKIGFELGDAARELIAREGFDPVYGARPLKRFIQREVETRIGRALIAGEAREGSRIRAEVRDGHLAVEVAAPGATSS
jgi:ATP-dependent Clp protease ATP-binding subunit ClpB